MKLRAVYFLVLLILVFALIRVAGLNSPVFDDETNFIDWQNDPGPLYNSKNEPHPPFFGWNMYFSGWVFGKETWAFRLVPLFYWIINCLLIYVIVSQFYSSRAAILSVLLFAVSFYSTLMSMQIAMDGSTSITVYLLMSLFYLQFCRTKRLIYLLPLGISFGIGLLDKISVIFLLPIMFSHYIIMENTVDKFLLPKQIWRTIKSSFILFFVTIPIGVLVYSIFPILDYDAFLLTISHASNYYGLDISWMAISMLLFWTTPLFIGLFLFYLPKMKKFDSYWLIWVVFIFSIFTFLIQGRPGSQSVSGGVAEYSRHFMSLMIPFCIFGGVFLSRVKVKKKHIITGMVISVISLVSYFWINSQTTKALPRDFATYLQAILSLDFNFFFSFTTSSGNLLGVNMGIIIFGIILGFILILIYFIAKLLRKYELGKWVLVLFISTGVAMNVFLVAEYLGPVTSPDANQALLEMVDYVQNNDLKMPLYANDEGFFLNLNNLEVEIKESQYSLGKYFERLDEGAPSGTFAIYNWPPVSRDNVLFKVLADCYVKKQFYSKSILLGEIYVC